VPIGDPRTGSAPLARCLVVLVAVSLSVVLAWSGSANAGYGAAAAPTFPSVVTVGNKGLPASFQLSNNNSAPNTSDINTVCNFGDAFPCPTGDPGITLIPSCGQLGAFSACVPTGADPGVFQISPTAVGAAGTACDGMVFDVAAIDPAFNIFGQMRFTPQAGGHVFLTATTGPLSMCQINFTFDVLKTPTIDQDLVAPGPQTVQVVDNTQYVGQTTNTASGRGTTLGTTVARATPAIATVASANVTLGSGQLADSATVSGRINPQPGATIDFRLYGPNDVACSGVPVFTSLGVSYPVTGGAVTSGVFSPVAAGDYRWVASYSGDQNNTDVAGACNAANEIVTVVSPPAPPPPPVVLSQGPSLPATGSSRTGPLLYIAFGLTLTGCLLVRSTSSRRRPSPVRSLR
jgi:hypothetical protein